MPHTSRNARRPRARRSRRQASAKGTRNSPRRTASLRRRMRLARSRTPGGREIRGTGAARFAGARGGGVGTTRSSYDPSYDVPLGPFKGPIGPRGLYRPEGTPFSFEQLYDPRLQQTEDTTFPLLSDEKAFDRFYGIPDAIGGGVGDGVGGGGGGGGGGGPTAPQDATFSVADINIEGAPEWWRAMIPDITNPQSSYQTMANLLIPMLSPEDQRTVASNLFQSAPGQFGLYNPEGLGLPPIPGEITSDLQSQYLSGQRAQTTLDAFDRLLEVSGKTGKDFGPGYNFLRGLADTIGDFELTSGATQFTETQQSQLLAALDPQLAQTKNPSLAAFGPLAKSFTSPFFSGGSIYGSGSPKRRSSRRNPRYY